MDTPKVIAHTAMDETSGGAFVRKESAFRSWIRKDKSTEFEPESGRYHLYVSLACPWASRCLAVRALQGLEESISVTVVHPVFQRTRPDSPEDTHTGWLIREDPEFPECTLDPLFGAHSVREIYEQCHDTLGKYTVPILVDKRTRKIVNNESSEIIRMFTKEFTALAKNPQLDLYPDALSAQIDEFNLWIYPGLNNGVYRAGFSRAQAPYTEAVTEVFQTLDRLEAHLQLTGSNFLVDNTITEADIRLFVTLIRFDEVYHVHFKCDKKRIIDYPFLDSYTRHFFRLPGISQTVNLRHIKHHYYRSHPTINPFGIVPIGPGIDYSK